MLARDARAAEDIGRTGRLGLGVLPLDRVGGVLAHARPGLERQILLADDGTEFRERPIEADTPVRARIEGVADRGKEAQIVSVQ